MTISNNQENKFTIVKDIRKTLLTFYSNYNDTKEFISVLAKDLEDVQLTKQYKVISNLNKEWLDIDKKEETELIAFSDSELYLEAYKVEQIYLKFIEHVSNVINTILRDIELFDVGRKIFNTNQKNRLIELEKHISKFDEHNLINAQSKFDEYNKTTLTSLRQSLSFKTENLKHYKISENSHSKTENLFKNVEFNNKFIQCLIELKWIDLEYNFIQKTEVKMFHFLHYLERYKDENGRTIINENLNGIEKEKILKSAFKLKRQTGVYKERDSTKLREGHLVVIRKHFP